MSALDKKYEKLKRFIEEKGRDGVVIAFSGGIDSSTLAAVSHEILGKKAVAVTAQSPTYTPEELEEAKTIAKEIGIKLVVIETNELSDKNFSRNPENRCYYCKKELLNRLLETAHELGFKTVFEGTNFSDLTGHRPGFKAVKEMEQVYSPWVETRFTKEEIRGLAEKIGLSIKDKPANACLASRIPFHEQITAEKLQRIGKSEKIIRELTGVKQLRVRDHNGLARIEVKKEERTRLCNAETMDEIARRLKALGFKYVTIDAEGYRTGSMLSTLEGKGSGN
jgi:uncharacterized protein